MIYPKIEDCIAKALNSKYILVSMVAHRAKDLTARAGGQFSNGKEKELSYAMREVIDGKIMPMLTPLPEATLK